MPGRRKTSTKHASKTAKRKAAPAKRPPVPCLWFNKDAEAAARFYVSIFPRSRIVKVHRSPADNPSTKKGEVLMVDFTIFGQPFNALNGGPYFTLSEAVSFIIDCKDQAEMDHYYKVLSAEPKSEQCGWIKDKFGVSWQLQPRALTRLMSDKDPAKAQRVMEAFLPMKRLDIAALERAAKGKPANPKPRVAA